LRTIRRLVDRVLVELSPDFDRLYAKVGRPSVPPEKLLRALLLQVLYTIRSERLRGGFVRPLMPVGARARKSDSVAVLYDVFGNEQEMIRSPIDSWIMTYPPYRESHSSQR
jgi:hypothetical protein